MGHELQELDMPRRKIAKYEGKKYFSTREAAEYTGMVHRTFKHHAFIEKQILGALISRVRVFTREELDDYAENENFTRVTSGRLDLADAAIYLEMSEEGLLAAVEEGRLPAVEYGGNLLFTPEQLDDFRINGGRTDVEAEIPFFSTSEAADFAGMEEDAFRQHFYKYGNVETILVGRNRVIERDELKRFIATKRDRGRPKGTD